MSISQDVAMQLAVKFLQQRPGAEAWPVNYDSPKVSYERAGHGTTHLGMGSAYWAVVFSRVEQVGVIMSPSSVIVFVDEQSGKVERFSTL